MASIVMGLEVGCESLWDLKVSPEMEKVGNHCVIEMLQCSVWKCESPQGWRLNHEERICEDLKRKPQVVSSKNGSELCLSNMTEPIICGSWWRTSSRKSKWTSLTSLNKALTLIQLKTCRGGWTEDQGPETTTNDCDPAEKTLLWDLSGLSIWIPLMLVSISVTASYWCLQQWAISSCFR